MSIKSTIANKTQPRPILKKSSPNVFITSDALKKVPVFFSGNEIISNKSDTSDEEPSDENNHEYNLSMSVEKMRKEMLKMDMKDEERFTLSALTKPAHYKKKFRKRSQSAVYIFHSKDINKEIIRMLIQSTDGFLEDFKRKVKCETANDCDLLKYYKDELLENLKDFLNSSTNESSNFYDRMHAFEIGVTLSEPLLVDIQNLRITNQKDKLLSQSNSETLFKHGDFLASSIDSHGNISNENIYGSLPTSKYFDLHSNKPGARESVLINLLKSKTSKCTNHLIRKRQDKCIVSEASATKKIVRFADSFGLDLEKVKVITNNSFVDAFYNQDEPDEDCKADSLFSGSSSGSKSFLVLIPLFGLKKAEAIVKLDDYIYDYENKIIRCIIKVRNISFHKKIFARITFNNWNTFYDLDAMYIKSEPANLAVQSATNKENTHGKTKAYPHDYFGFCILLPERNLATSSSNSDKPFDDCTLRIEFAICYQWDGGANFCWDNNSNENYKFQCFYNKSG